ncbi:hypothetical protein CAI21_06345 [Alkalilimnicola ehrlichii]|uniref:Alginate export domain-containing protein n=2 Tax=Alkalilimnicola ehrlichii TaxID=351052 RepID=A0A3E0WYD3_9GAMM|nr:hypothetical protein CAI21_06345 [Alkalilimnicola ehrlichii]RFA37818.1 hypothetical protein CAL65_07700 [Alkalilimnicola ehrlichii]
MSEENGITVGGAVRLNYHLDTSDDAQKDRGGDFDIELFRLNVAGTLDNIELSAEWRQYRDFQTIHHAWIGYAFSDTLNMELGITQVPFGLLPFASHSFWFSGAHYLGYEDNYDTGIKFEQLSGDWLFTYAFFKNAEYASSTRTETYSVNLAADEVPTDETDWTGQYNTEINTFNLRIARTLAPTDQSATELGVSGQYGQIYNHATARTGDRWAAAVHLDGEYGPWNLQLQATRYAYSPENPADVSDDFVQKRPSAGRFDGRRGRCLYR